MDRLHGGHEMSGIGWYRSRPSRSGATMMAVKIGVYFDQEDAERVIDSLQSLPSTIRPIFFSEEESLKSRNDQLIDEQRFRKFRDRNPAGFFLFSGKEIEKK